MSPLDQHLMLTLLIAVVGSLSAEACFDRASCASKEVLPTSQIDDETALLQTASTVKRYSGTQVHQHQHNSTTIVQQLAPGDIEKTNLVLVRVAKTGSTTACGVTRNIAMLHNLSGAFEGGRRWITEKGEPGIWAAHGALSSEDYGPNPINEPVDHDGDGLPSFQAVQALNSPAFLWTMVRDPAERAMSQYYWLADRMEAEPTTASKMDYLTAWAGDEIFRYIRPSAESTLDQVFNTYGLIGVLERYDESLVVLAAKLKVPLSDMLYLSAKNSSTGFMDDENLTHHVHPPLDEEPQVVRDFMNNGFRENHVLDYQLHERANQKLDAEIAEMNLESAVKAFKSLLAEAQEACQVPGIGSTAIEDLTKCFVVDQGCNYECLNKFHAIGLEQCTWCV